MLAFPLFDAAAPGTSYVMIMPLIQRRAPAGEHLSGKICEPMHSLGAKPLLIATSMLLDNIRRIAKETLINVIPA